MLADPSIEPIVWSEEDHLYHLRDFFHHLHMGRAYK